MSKKYNLYLGKAGQFAVMSHFLMRGWNVAVPEVDVGDDLLVVEDKKGIFFRVQVKTAQAVERNKGL
jgi:PD-(D/E)XK endonuclease